MMNLAEWKECASRGTRGDMVHEILRDWEIDMGDPQNIHIFKEGNQWCAIIGANTEQGIAGFGETPSEAVIALTNHDAFDEWSNNLH